MNELDLKKHLLHLTEVLQITKNLNSGLQKKNEDLEIQNRTLEEDYNTLKDNYENLKKRNDQLQKEITELKNGSKKKGSMLDWFINPGAKDENERLTQIIKVLEFELRLKIEENEQCHIEAFEIKQNFDLKITQLENEIEKLKLMINEKNNEFNLLGEKHNSLINANRLIENNLNTTTENLKKVTHEFKTKTEGWKIKKETLNKEIEVKNLYQTNLMPINEYKSKETNLLNLEYLSLESNTQALRDNQTKFLYDLLQGIKEFYSGIDHMMNYIIERFNFFCTNIDEEHKSFHFLCEKIRLHSFHLQQIVRVGVVFVKLLSNFDSNQVLYLNVFLTICNKLTILFELIGKYFKLLMREEKNISYFDNIGINKELKTRITEFVSHVKLIVRKINFIFDFNVEYNFSNIHLISDNSAGVLLKIKEGYLRDYKTNPILKLKYKLSFLKFLNNDLVRLQSTSDKLVNSSQIKIDQDYKAFELMKEDSNNTRRYSGMINLPAFKFNGDNLKKSFKDIRGIFVDQIMKVLDFATFSHYFKIKSWEMESFVNLMTKNTPLHLYERNFNERIVKLAKEQGDEIEYKEALLMRNTLQELTEKENTFTKDKENYENKVYEYELDIKRYKEKINELVNQNDLLRTKLTSGVKSESTRTLTVVDDDSITVNDFDDYLKMNPHMDLNLSKLKYEVLSDDVQTGIQRSSFKLTDETYSIIPLNEFTEVPIAYHRKVLEMLQRYKNKVKNVEVKVMASLQADEMKAEYEYKLKHAMNENLKEMDILKEQVRQKDEAVEGFMQQIHYLSESLTELDELKNQIKDCTRCKKLMK